jgi:hypothetical protein
VDKKEIDAITIWPKAAQKVLADTVKILLHGKESRHNIIDFAQQPAETIATHQN